MAIGSIEWTSAEEMKISAVIPAHNEEKTIGEIVQRCRRYCEEVIVVDDASTDMTSRIARAAGAKVIHNPANLGFVRSTEIGLKSASQEIIVTLDADGQHDPHQIPDLARPIVEDRADLVLGKREHDRPLSERLLSAIISCRVECEDVGTGYRAFRRNLAHNIRLWGFCLCGSLVLEAQRSGARIAEVPIDIKPRLAGRSHWAFPFSRTAVHCKQAMLLIRHMAG